MLKIPPDQISKYESNSVKSVTTSPAPARPSHGDPKSAQGPPRLVVSVAEAAAMLTLSKAMLYKLVEAGAFPIIKIGTRSVITVAAIEAYLANCPTGVGDGPNKKKVTAPALIAAEEATPKRNDGAAAGWQSGAVCSWPNNAL